MDGQKKRTPEIVGANLPRLREAVHGCKPRPMEIQEKGHVL